MSKETEDPYVGLAREYNAVCDKLSAATARAYTAEVELCEEREARSIGDVRWEAELTRATARASELETKLEQAQVTVSDIFGALHNPFIDDESRLRKLVALLPLTGAQLDAGKTIVAQRDTELADVAYLDDIGRKFGTRYDSLDLPAEIPGIDEDHIHFVLMPIGPVSRRAAVAWLQARLDLVAPDRKGETNG